MGESSTWLPWVLTLGGLSSAGILGYLWYQLRQQLTLRDQRLLQLQNGLNVVQSEKAGLQQNYGQLQSENLTLQEGRTQLQKEKASQDRVQTALEDQLRALKDDNISLHDECDRLRRELDGRPAKRERRYGIATIGVSGSGKTALTLRWANDIYRINDYVATQFAKYTKRVSQVLDREENSQVEHIFEIYDWGGEHIEEAFTALIQLGAIHALVMVVDLGPYLKEQKKNVFDEEHIRRQLTEFNPHVLRLLFAPAIIAHCKHYILFINKSDLIAGFQGQIEDKARTYYKRLIDDMEDWSSKRGVTLKIIVGSAETGVGTNLLFPYLIENILPETARDDHLQQQVALKSSGGAAPAAVATANAKPENPHPAGPQRAGQASKR